MIHDSEILTGQNAILRASESAISKRKVKGIGVSKGVKNKPLNVENRSERRARLDNKRLKEFRDLVRKDGINSSSSCQHVTPERRGAYLVGPALPLSELIIAYMSGQGGRFGYD